MDRMAAVLQELRRFVQERDWEQFHDPKNLAMAIASEAGELLAEYRWVSNAEADAVTNSLASKAQVMAEVADIAIPLFLFCDRIGIDLIDAMREKMKTNHQNYPVELSRGKSERPKQA